MLERALNILNIDETFSNETFKINICCLYVVDMNERVEDANGMDEGSWMRRARQNGRKHIMHISTRNTSARWIRTRQLLLTYTYGILAWMSSVERC